MSEPIPPDSAIAAAAKGDIREKQMAASGPAAPEVPEHKPYVPDVSTIPEFTWPAVLVGAILGIIFGASSLYLVLKVGLTVSASIPVAVLSITLFRLFSRLFGFRRATILENNIVQTTGSAGESIAFGVGVTMPVLLLLGFEMDVVRVMTVGVLGGLLGILMMIPLRRAFIVKQHGQLAYPEGTACAEVLVTGEKGGATALMVFLGFGVAAVYKFCAQAMHLWKEVPGVKLYTEDKKGLNGAVLDGELSPELLGVGYIIGPRIASIMVAGGVLAYLVIAPLIKYVGDDRTAPLAPAEKSGEESGLIKDMDTDALRGSYIIYIGAGAVATGGIVSMFQALPLIITAFGHALRDLRASKESNGNGPREVPRTERDLPVTVVIFGSLGLVIAIAALPSLGLGFNLYGIVGAILIVFLGFLFVTVSSRLTGEIGSSSNPISGMTVATLLITCLVFYFMGKTDKAATLTALSVAAIVCVASSNGGTTSQDLKTGYLVGGTPKNMQLAILVGALTSAVVIGYTLLLLNQAGTVWSKKNLPQRKIENVQALSEGKQEKAGGQYADDPNTYYVVNVAEGEFPVEGSKPAIPAGRYLVDEQGTIQYYVDPAINGKLKEWDDGTKVAFKPTAPKTILMKSIISGIFDQSLPWTLVLIGVLIAVTLELSGVPSLPFAVGVYLPLSASTPIFIGGMMRYLVDRLKGRAGGEGDTSPGVLLSSGYIAGGTIAGVVVTFFTFAPKAFNDDLDIGTRYLGKEWLALNWPTPIVFGALLLLLIVVGSERFFRTSIVPPTNDEPINPPSNP
jgi:putative OPT family oligopeptide transporter